MHTYTYLRTYARTYIQCIHTHTYISRFLILYRYLYKRCKPSHVSIYSCLYVLSCVLDFHLKIQGCLLQTCGRMLEPWICPIPSILYSQTMAPKTRPNIHLIRSISNPLAAPSYDVFWGTCKESCGFSDDSMSQNMAILAGSKRMIGPATKAAKGSQRVSGCNWGFRILSRKSGSPGGSIH